MDTDEKTAYQIGLDSRKTAVDEALKNLEKVLEENKFVASISMLVTEQGNIPQFRCYPIEEAKKV